MYYFSDTLDIEKSFFAVFFVLLYPKQLSNQVVSLHHIFLKIIIFLILMSYIFSSVKYLLNKTIQKMFSNSKCEVVDLKRLDRKQIGLTTNTYQKVQVLCIINPVKMMLPQQFSSYHLKGRLDCLCSARVYQDKDQAREVQGKRSHSYYRYVDIF